MATKTMTVTFPESTSRTGSKTVTIPKLKNVVSVTVNTGNVTHSVNGENVTVNVSNGAYTRYTTYTPSKSASDSITIQVSENSGAPSFPATKSYNDGTYSGTLSKSGSPSFFEYDATTDLWTQQYSGTVYAATQYTYYYAYTVTIEYIDNSDPSINLTTTDNLVLSEGNTVPVEGSATEADAGNVVTVKYKINNGTARALQSGVSDGSTPLSFAKTLTYSNKRLYDGAVDVTGVNLAEGVDHMLTVWSEDDQGGKSSEVTRKFQVVWNRPPVISGANEDLGTILVPPTKNYSVTEPESDTFTITEMINGTVIRSFSGTGGQEYTVTIPHDLWIRLDLDTPHSLSVEATESKGLTSSRTFTFIRTETHIEFMLDLDNPDVRADFYADGMPKRVLVTLDKYLPAGSSIESVKVTNNALDATPAWEDATGAVNGGRGYLFTNQTKTAADWEINIWVTIDKGTATERVRVNGYGGAFD